MRWTSDNDQLLLLKILETHDLSVDTKKVAQAWPGNDPKEKPTPRAITERLAKMRQIVKSNGAECSFAISKGTGTPGRARTPKTPKTPKTATPKTPVSNKRKFIETENTPLATDDDDQDEKKTPISTENMMSEFLKLEDDDLDLVQNQDQLNDTPTKRVRKACTPHPGMVNYAEDDEGVESSASEYHPDAIKSEDDLELFA